MQHVAVDARTLETRVKAARARGLTAEQEAVADGVSGHIDKARDAAFRVDPIPRLLPNWWRGTLVEAAYRNLHAAQAQLIDLLDNDEVLAEIPAAVARSEAALPRDDPRKIPIEDLYALPSRRRRPLLRRLMEDSHQALDGKHAQLRSFRNILLLTASFVTLLVVATVVIVAVNPNWIPLCFPAQDTGTATAGELNCPTRSEADGPSWSDIVIVSLLGALGGALAAAVSIRNLKGTSTPYDVPVALSALKVPLGAFTAILALVAIRGDFVPGLSFLDSQQQILAYALVFGYAQQALTRLLDRQAQTLLEDLPGGTGAEPPRIPATARAPAADEPEPDEDRPAPDKIAADAAEADLPYEDVEVISSEEPVVAEPAADEEDVPAVVAADEVVLPDPLIDQGDELQDDEPAELAAPDDVPAQDDVGPDDVGTGVGGRPQPTRGDGARRRTTRRGDQ